MIKLGALNTWERNTEEQLGSEFNSYIVDAFRYHGIDFELKDCLNEECNIVFVSSFPKHNFSEVKGHPVFIYYTGESARRDLTFGFDTIKHCDYSFTFFNDSDTNLFLPMWQINYDRYRDNFSTINKNIGLKKNFCSFIVSNGDCQFDGAKLRGDCFDKLSEYKKVFSFGRYKNNVGGLLPDYKTNFKDCQRIHASIKFNLCFENTSSLDGENYTTEKILHAYAYGTVPIYWGGGEKLLEYFNKDSFINCNGLSLDEMKERVIWYDCHDNEYEKMLYTFPFNENRDWKVYTYDRIINFLKDKGLV